MPLIPALLYALIELIGIYKWIVIIAAVFSTLASFGVLDTRNRFVWAIGDFFYRATEPALRPIRNRLPNFGGLDFSPVILIIVLYLLQVLLARVGYALQTGNVQSIFL